MNIIILTEKDFVKVNVYRISDERALHIRKILKSEVGDILEIGLLNRSTGTAKLIGIDDSRIELEVLEFNSTNEDKIKIEIVCALPRPQTLKKVLSTCATMGVSSLFLIRSEKVEKSYFHSPILKEENYTKFLIEGLSQGKRTRVPKIEIHHKFKDFFNNGFQETFNNSTCLIAHPDTNKYLSKNIFSANKNLLIAIGPEAGWNDFEVGLMQEMGFLKFRLSDSILRVENAVTAALAQIEIMKNS